MSNFWKTLPKPFMVLAPMEDVTDVVFREIVATLLPKPDVFFTEFTNADGLCSKGREVTIKKLKYTENQRPIVAQIWGTNTKTLYESAKLCKEMKFDGIDINMGCPDRAVMRKGAGAALVKDPALAKEIIDAVREGADGTPVSVKTRIGFNSVVTDEWVPFLLEQKLDALTIHGRTAKQKSDVPANWEEIGKAVDFKNKISPETILSGNGDIKSFKQAKEMHEKYKVDGVMVGRGIFSNPWVFEREENIQNRESKEYIKVLSKHLQLYSETWENSKNFEMMKKFFKMYINNFPGASILRQHLMECRTSEQVNVILKDYISDSK